MDNILYKAAETFSKVMNYDYIYTLGNSKRKITISVLSSRKEEFTHIFGIDHLTDVNVLVAHNTRQKTAIFNNILRKKITDDCIKNSNKLNKSIPGSFNVDTNKEYTIKERIEAINNLEYILDNSYKGRIYRWDKNKSNILMQDGKVRRSLIEADYLLVVPSERNLHENYYLFLYQTNKNKKDEPIKLNVFSAFPDCVNLACGQAAGYTILELIKRDYKNNIENLIYVHPKYALSVNFK